MCVLSVSPVARAGEAVLDCMPEDAVLVVQVEALQRLLPQKLMLSALDAMEGDDKVRDMLIDVVKKFPGEVAIGIVPDKKDGLDGEPEVYIAIELARPDVKFDEFLEATLLPALKTLVAEGASDAISLKKHDGLIQMVDKSGSTVFAWAWKDRVAFGSNRPNQAPAWRRGDFPKKPWTGSPGVRRMIRALPKKSAARVMLIPRVLLKAIPKAPSNSLEELAMDALAPEDVESVALDLEWGRNSLELTLTASLIDDCKGVLGALTHASSDSTALGLFPGDFCVLGRIGWPSVQALVDGAYGITDRVDETIVQEYREDLASFKTEFGVDWDGGLLSNMAGEMAFGVRVDFTRKVPIGWAAVHRIADRAAFQRQLDQLIARFELPLRVKENGGLRIQTGGERMPMAFAVAGEWFIAADSAETVAEIAKQAMGPAKGSPANAAIREMREELGSTNLASCYLDVELLTQKVPVLALALGPKLSPLVLRGCVGFSSSCRENVSTTVLKWDLGRGPKSKEDREAADDATGEVMAAVAQLLTESIGRSRDQAKRMVSMSNMRGIGMAIMMYADSHKGAYPGSLEALVKAAPDSVALEQFRSPYSQEGPSTLDELTAKSYLIYRPGLSSNSPAAEIILCERTLIPGQDGANFLFVDGHVEFIAQPEAGEIIRLMESGAPSVTRAGAGGP